MYEENGDEERYPRCRRMTPTRLFERPSVKPADAYDSAPVRMERGLVERGDRLWGEDMFCIAEPTTRETSMTGLAVYTLARFAEVGYAYRT